MDRQSVPHAVVQRDESRSSRLRCPRADKVPITGVPHYKRPGWVCTAQRASPCYVRERERPSSPVGQRPGLLLTVSPTGPVDGHEEDVRYSRDAASRVRAKSTGGSIASLRLRGISPSLPCHPVAVPPGVAQRHQDGVTPISAETLGRRGSWVTLKRIDPNSRLASYISQGEDGRWTRRPAPPYASTFSLPGSNLLSLPQT